MKPRSQSGSSRSPLLERHAATRSSSMSSDQPPVLSTTLDGSPLTQPAQKQALTAKSLLDGVDEDSSLVSSSSWRICARKECRIGCDWWSVPDVSSVSCAHMHDSLPLAIFSNVNESSILLDVSKRSVVRTFAQPFTAACLDFCGSMAVAGARTGSGVYVCRAGDSSSSASSLWQRYGEDSPLDSGGIGAVVCSPGDRGFGVCYGSNFSLWDYLRPLQPLHSASIWPLHHRALSAATDAVSGTLCAVGSSDASLVILDYRALARSRGAAVAAKIPQAHGGAVKSVQWHPHVPHWLASAGEDGKVLVWDSRQMRSHVASSSITAPVVAVSWARSHSELLASVAVDGSASLWNFRLQPSARRVAYADPLTRTGRPLLSSVGWLMEDVPVLCCVDAGGSVSYAALSQELLRPLSVTSGKEDAICKLLYVRDLPVAFELIVERAQLLISNGKHEDALELVQMCYPRGISSNSNDPVAPFLEDMRSMSMFLPPNFPIPSKANASLRAIKRLRMTLLLHQMKVKESWKEAFAATDEICNFIKKPPKRPEDPPVLPVDVIKDVVAMVLRHHYLSGLTMGCKLLRSVPEDHFGRFSALTRLLLSPTVFDGFSGGVSNSSTDLDYVLNNQRVGLSQVDFVRDFTARMWNESPFARVEKMMRKTETTLVSVCATVNRVYLYSLLQTGQYTRFFLAASTIAIASPGCEFSSSILPNQIVARGHTMALEWANLVLEELRSSFDVAKAKAVVQLCCAIMMRASFLVTKQVMELSAKVLQSVATLVKTPNAATVLTDSVHEISSQTNDEQVKLFLSKLAI